VEANAPGPSLAILVGARTTDPARAQQIAQATAEQLVKYVADEETRAFIPARDQIVMTIVVPSFLGVKVEPTKGRAAIFAVVAGAIALVLFYVLVQYVIIRRRQ
jgi:hypothetical protein